MATTIPIRQFLQQAASPLPVIDVRAPKEFSQGHIPNAHNLPLFDDHQRSVVGTAYRHNGRQAAILKGLEMVGPKMRDLAEQSWAIAKQPGAPDGRVLMHCWRGGMRSQSVAWLLEQTGMQVQLLEGGYKSYRRFVLQQFQQAWPLVVISGLTGAGKTRQLRNLRHAGQQVIDLEQLANHQGSVFGGFDQAPQPTVEQFENNLAHLLGKMAPAKPIWIEDESQSIGKVAVPTPFFKQYRLAPAIFLDVPREARARFLAAHYGNIDVAEIESGIESIRDRLGGQNVNRAKRFLAENRWVDCADCLLEYYDKAYLKSQQKHPRTQLTRLSVDDPESDQTESLISWANSQCLE